MDEIQKSQFLIYQSEDDRIKLRYRIVKGFAETLKQERKEQ